MRLGQAVCDYVTLPTDPEIRLCIVPLTEALYLQALEKVLSIEAQDDLAGMAIRERVQATEILARSIREESDLTKVVYESAEQMTEDLEVVDIDELIDRYNEMIAISSPSIDGIPDEELEHVKKLLQEMDWSGLSGRAWHALKRFLSTISPTPLLDNSLGFISTNSLTTTSESDESMSTVSQNSIDNSAKSVTNP
jgi:hypothetical protein